ncbi:hypothetical protein AAAZ42_19940 [Bacteroides ovatus]|nr:MULTISPECIES: hypothetical protein [Bacteroides]KAA4215499.1 hypothetical protein F3D27_06735 [Bacteroides ovatus]KAA4390481.1 hypothetical protein F3C89_16790 [Bacteroides ovatus]MDC2381291.1 hypothetical protein [Bacteroides ovatus]
MYTESVYVVDYREYTKDGFTISPTVTGFNYQPISNIEVVFTVGKLRKGETAENLRLIVPYEGYTGKTNNEYAPSSKRMMDKIVSEAKKMGANGLIDFKTTYNARNRAWVASGIAVIIK